MALAMSDFCLSLGRPYDTRLEMFRCIVTEAMCRSPTFSLCSTVTHDARTEWLVYLQERLAFSEIFDINFPMLSFPSGAATK